MNKSLSDKLLQVKQELQELDSLAIAYSGGVDSSLLAALAYEFMPKESVELIIADSPSIPRSELKEAQALASEKNWRLTVLYTHEIDKAEYQANSGNRCYYCKSELFSEMSQYAHENNIKTMAYGAILDDLSDHRPGAQAAEEYSVIAPLQILSKEEIRELSKERNLPTASRASFACLASRLPQGEKVTIQKLSQIEMAEEILKKYKFHQYRARHHGELIRIEVEEEALDRFFDKEFRQQILSQLKKVGYRHITLDLAGYRTGSTH
ncbi:ATP-dependent sacrificial sulfur transferase LarE [Lentisphaera profundi]|uniref:ATP-dependent sacrificial sulfur transferase LarE n=1 Tax=Lentisphaera profundi TaxID=1658616 RepID=A0ABY7W147_9BACT|nr:ATP-dependent sacrificial sulfur transferase LarE [Lentisphaera profundi]WDE98756.1 ATP-dependent sacrificial sulfur transferase LarE [Lentisphaera profundi]